jgi:phosphoenolpyruvate carboxykinase (GTP)
VGACVYGGRDSDTPVPVRQSVDWAHGIVTMGASLESETTAATLGAAGVRKFNLMSILDFLSIPLGRYVQNNLDFARELKMPPRVFATNYFIKGADGEYLTDMLDKGVWMKWMELRVHGDVEAVRGPTGWLPRYEDLRRLFREHRGGDYAERQYVRQFTVRVPEHLAKIARMEKVYGDVVDTPAVVFETLAAQRERLEALRAEKGDYVSPLEL